jgi:hypothetical protein
MIGKVYLSMAAGVRDEITGSSPMLTCAASNGRLPILICMWGLCCVCVYYYRRRSLVGVHFAIVMKVLVIRRRAHIKEGGGQSGGVACKLCATRRAPESVDFIPRGYVNLEKSAWIRLATHSHMD